MARVTDIKIDIDRGRTDRLTRGVTGDTAHAAAVIMQRRARKNIIRKGRVDTGRLRDSIEVKVDRQTNTEAMYSVGSSVPYARYQEEGIGPVYPRRAKVLRFKPKGSSTFVFAHRTRGFKGAFFMREAWRSLRTRDFNTLRFGDRRVR